MKNKINPFDYAQEIVSATPRGILVTTKADKVDTMTIGWGSLGTEWQRPIFTIYVRSSRFTFSQLEKNPAFTISVPLGDYDRKLIAKAGVLTGWKTDKIAELGLTLEEALVNGVPGIKEFPLTLECQVIYKKEQPLAEIHIDNKDAIYPQDVTDKYKGCNKYDHTEFIGQIVAAYIIE